MSSDAARALDRLAKDLFQLVLQAASDRKERARIRSFGLADWLIDLRDRPHGAALPSHADPLEVAISLACHVLEEQRASGALLLLVGVVAFLEKHGYETRPATRWEELRALLHATTFNRDAISKWFRAAFVRRGA